MRVALVAGALLGLSVTAVLPAGAGDLPGGPSERESFEVDFGGWSPQTDGLARDWKIYRTKERAGDGFVSLGYYLDGRDDDGTIWIEKAFEVPFAGPMLVDVSFLLQGPAPDITGWPVVAAAGERDPQVESDFTIVGRAGRTPAWTKYELHTKIGPPSKGVIWVAVGVSATWETIRVHYIDLVEVTITPV